MNNETFFRIFFFDTEIDQAVNIDVRILEVVALQQAVSLAHVTFEVLVDMK